jgi:hypothetical protein
MYKCVNCKYEGADSKEGRFCPVCGDNVYSLEDKQKIIEEEKITLTPKEDFKIGTSNSFKCEPTLTKKMK